ncbi:hypothetical protein ACFUMH_05255 [Cellulomonas sp. NPDC057328]|uniref:hypothetical protein n=1 Tax=Cellulomonas sp. NPDC057328 TaxID=3346101 RepID=UPI00363CA93D
MSNGAEPSRGLPVPLPPWSGSQLRRLGRALREGEASAEGCPSYPDVMLHYNDLATAVNDELRALDWDSLLGPAGRPQITSRAKTLTTLTSWSATRGPPSGTCRSEA